MDTWRKWRNSNGNGKNKLDRPQKLSCDAVDIFQCPTTTELDGCGDDVHPNTRKLSIPMDLRDWVEGASSKSLSSLDCGGCRLECIEEAYWLSLAEFYTHSSDKDADKDGDKDGSTSDTSLSTATTSSTPSTYTPLSVHIEMVTVVPSPSSAPSAPSAPSTPSRVVTIAWDERDCTKHYHSNRFQYMESETKFVQRNISVHLLRNGVGVPGRVVEIITVDGADEGSKDSAEGKGSTKGSDDVKDAAPVVPTRKQPARSARTAAKTRGQKEFTVDADFTVPRLLLLCLQEFTVIKEDAQLGRLQLYMNGKKLVTTGTLFSEGVKPGSLLYLKQLDENDQDIEGKDVVLWWAVFVVVVVVVVECLCFQELTTRPSFFLKSDISMTDAFAPSKKAANSGGFQGTALFGGSVATSEIDLTLD